MDYFYYGSLLGPGKELDLDTVANYQVLDSYNKYGVFHGLLNPKKMLSVLIIDIWGGTNTTRMTLSEYEWFVQRLAKKGITSH